MKKFFLVIIIAISVLAISFTSCQTGRRDKNSSSSSVGQSSSISSSIEDSSSIGQSSSEETSSSESISSSESSSSEESISSESSSSSIVEESNSSESSSSSSSSQTTSNSSCSSSSSSSSNSSSSSQVKEYEIIFADEDGTELYSITIEENGEVVYGGQEPSKESTAEFTYTFVGWTDGTQVYAKGEELPVASKGVTYTAVYREQVNTYTITWEIEGKITTETYEYGATPEYKGETPSKASTAQYTYSFKGWNTSSTATTTITLGAVSKDITYYAIFSSIVNQYVISITQPTGGTITVNNGTATISSGTKVDYGTTLTISNNANIGYSFKNYTVNGISQTTTSITVIGVTTISGEYTPDSYTITYNANGGSVSPTSKEVSYNGIYGTLPTPTKAGYTFNGWKKASAVYSDTLSAGTDKYKWYSVLQDLVPGETYNITIDKAVTDFADETATTFWVRIHDFTQGKAWDTEYLNEGYNLSFSLTCPADVPETNDIQLLIYAGIPGSTENNNLTLTNFIVYEEHSESVTSDAKVTTTDNHVLIADWKANNYTITYNANGGTVSPASKSVTFNSAYGSLATPTKSGYAFQGWATSSTIISKTIIASSTNNTKYDTMLYGVTPGTTYNIFIGNVNLTGDTDFTIRLWDFTKNILLAYKTVSVGTGSNVTTTITCPSSAVAENDLQLLVYAGVAGSTAGNTIELTNFNISWVVTSETKVNIESNHTLTAQWMANNYTITWKNWDGTTLETDTNVAYGTTPTYNGSTPTKSQNGELFEFICWSPEITVVNGSKTYTAIFIERDIEYSDFGAVGNGSADDFEALFKAHTYANGTGATKVVAQSGKTYYIYNTVPSAKLLEWANGIINGSHTTAHNSSCIYGANKAHKNANGIATDCHGNIVTSELIAYINKNLSVIKSTSAVTIKIATDVVWTGAKFTIDDTNISALEISGKTAVAPTDAMYSKDIFMVVSDGYYKAQYFSSSQYDYTKAETMGDKDFLAIDSTKNYLNALNQQIQSTGIGKTTTKLNLNLGYPAMVVIYNEDLRASATRLIAGSSKVVEPQKVYIRYGSNANSGAAKQDALIIDANGNIDSSTPIMFDYTRIVKFEIFDLRVSKVTLSGGEFTTLASRIDPIFSINSDGSINHSGTDYRAAYLRRGIKINRSYTVLDGVKHYVTNELSLLDYDKGLDCVHYGAFYQVSQCANVTLKNCVLTGRRNNDQVGSYDFNANTVCGIYLEGCTQSNFWVVENADGTVVPATEDTANAVLGMSFSTKNSKRVQMLWGVGGTNWCKNMEYRGCTLSRFDAHQGLYNGKIVDSTVNLIAIIGKGTMTVENTTLLIADDDIGAAVILLRPDYGSTWEGNIYINNVNASVLSGGKVLTMVYYQYANHDFGYDCYIPNIYVNNFTINNVSALNNIYLFASYTTNTENIHKDTLSSGEVNKNKITMPTEFSIDNFTKYNYNISYRKADTYPDKCMAGIYIPVNIKVKYMTKEGTLLGSETVSVNYFDTYTITRKVFSGYEASSSWVKGCYAHDQQKEIIIYYSEISTAWNGTSASTSLSGSGTQASPYLIKTGADLKYIENQVDGGNAFAGKYFKFANSINLNNYSITIGYYNSTSDYKAFGGILDGNNCSIKNLKINNTATTNSTGSGSALFGCLSGSISNLNVYGSVTSKSSYTAGIVGGMLSGATITNCINFAEISGTSYMGGVVGVTNGSITNCKNYGTITSTSWVVGGVVGWVMGSGSATGCINFAQVTSSSSVGGVAGSVHNTITNCVNYGEVTGSSTAQVAGVVGYGKGTVSYCYNYGKVTGTNVAGIICSATASSTLNISYCNNYGEIVGKPATTYAVCNVGGIMSNTDNTTIVITSCNNYGMVSLSGAKQFKEDGTTTINHSTGGIIGTTQNAVSVTITKSNNYGELTSNVGRTGGIVGALYVGKIDTCVNYAIITGTNNVGGICGAINWAADSSKTLNSCTNRGAIKSSSYYAGGIAGVANQATITKCNNYANVGKSGGNSAGIVAVVYNTSTLNSCINYGNLIGKDNMGGIVYRNEGTINGCSNQGTFIDSNNDGTFVTGNIYIINTGTVA